MSERFFLDEPIDPAWARGLSGQSIVLGGDEGRHLATVMRAAVGDEITLFDGSGAEFTGRVLTVKKHAVELEIVERREISRELSFDLALAVALPKGERQKWLVEKLTELGVTRLVPLIAQRGVAQPVPGALERLQRGVIEASKQCGRNRLMEIAEPRTVEQLMAESAAGVSRLLADPSGTPLERKATAAASNVIAAIGPEGGFAPSEVQAGRDAGWQIVSLGSRILRVETAAIVLAASF